MEENKKTDPTAEDKPEATSGENDGPKAHVHLFGSEFNVDDHDVPREERRKRKEEWRAERRRLREEFRCSAHTHDHEGGELFGLLLVFAGAILVLNNFGLASWSIWRAITPLWPVLLVMLGLSIIMGRSYLARLLAFIISLVLLIYVLLFGLMRVDSPLVRDLPPGSLHPFDSSVVNQFINQ